MFKVFKMTDFCIRPSTLRALAPSSFLTDFSRCLEYVNYCVVLINPVTIVIIIIVSFITVFAGVLFVQTMHLRYQSLKSIILFIH